MIDVDPLASLKVWGAEFTVKGRTFDVPALPASEWFPILLQDDPLAVLDLVEGDVDDLLVSGEVTLEELSGALADVVEEVTGRSLHVCRVLAGTAYHSWMTFNGAMTMAGFRWDVQPIGAALDAVYHLVLKWSDEDGTRKFLDLLENEALSNPGSDRAKKKAEDDFSAMAGPRPTGGVLSTGAPSVGSRPRSRR